VRYFFDLFNGVQRIDMGGIELGNDAAARQEAKFRAMDGGVQNQLKLGSYIEIVVRDDTDREVYRIPIKR
jgi:hypothetical protein